MSEKVKAGDFNHLGDGIYQLKHNPNIKIDVKKPGREVKQSLTQQGYYVKNLWGFYYQLRNKAGLIDREGGDLEDENENGDEEDTTSLSLEKDLENYLRNKLNLLENGLSLIQTQYSIDYEGNRWYIDILAKDGSGNLVVIELKAGTAKADVCAQISTYIAVIKKTHPDAKEKKVRGIIIADDFDIGLKLAISNIPDALLKKYNIDFRFEDITCTGDKC